jgi:hypothetical protein
LARECVQRERAQQISAQARLDLIEQMAGALDPGERQSGGEALELAAQIDIAQQFGSAGIEQQQVFKQQREGAQ